MAKPRMKQKYFLIATVGFVIWLVETAYFGWNATPENSIEATFDVLSAVLIAWGIIGDILTNVSVHKTYEGDTFNVKNQKYIDARPHGITNKKTEIKIEDKS